MDVFNRKMLIIGIDGGTWKILDDAIEGGYMPYLQKLKTNGAYGVLNSTMPPISPAAWGTIQTGKDALMNHIYEFYSFNKKTKEITIVNSNFLKDTIWETLSKVGKKVAVVNVPMTYPPKKVNGFIVSGILTPSIDSNFIYPPELKQKILEKIPDYQLKYKEERRFGDPLVNLKSFINQRIKNLKDRTKICLYLLNNYKIDILMVNFQANDILQHSLWGYMDRDHYLYNKEKKDYIYKNFHKNLDLCIETLVEEYNRLSSNNILTMIISDHGFESHYKQFYLGDWLFRNNFIKIKRSSINSIVRRRIRELIEILNLGQLQVKILKTLTNLLSNLNRLLRKENKIKKFRQLIDLEKSKVYSTGIGLYGYIFILVNGNTKKQYIEYLKTKLLKLRDPETGLEIVKDILVKEEIYDGNKPELVPDLIIRPNKGFSLTGIYKGKKKLLEKISIKESESIGKHSEEGIIIMSGTSVNKAVIKNPSLKDIMPTILNYFGLPISNEITGKVLDYFKT